VLEQWRRVFQRATVTGGASLHAPPLMPETGGSALLSPSLPFPAGSEGTPLPAKHTKNASNGLFCFTADPVPSGLSRVDLLHCRSVSAVHPPLRSMCCAARENR